MCVPTTGSRQSNRVNPSTVYYSTIVSEGSTLTKFAEWLLKINTMTTKLAQSGLHIALLLFLTPVTLAQASHKFHSSNPVVLKDTRFEPVSIKVISEPDRSIGYATVKIGDYVSPTDYKDITYTETVVTGAKRDYQVAAEGLKTDGLPYSDRTIRLKQIPGVLQGLPLLQSKMGHKGIVDARFSIRVAAEEECLVFLAVDERAVEFYRKAGLPGWMADYAPTDLRLLSDDAIMKLSGAGYRVFVKKFGAGEIEFGPACAHVQRTAMYFACFAKAAALR